MSDIKHTRGPWVWADGYEGLFGLGPENEVLHYADYEGMWIAEWSERGVANARLIAAAPDLLHELIKARAELEAYELEATGEGYNNPALNAAISKATGEA